MNIVYVTTHYPSVSHTFIAREIDALRARGFVIETVAINPHHSDALQTESDEHAARTTTVLKAFGAFGTLRRLVGATLRHPGAVLRTLGLAQRGCGLDFARRLRRSFQVAEGVLLAGVCARANASHIHAHFGQAPANIAWFASEFAERCGRRATWSMTIHGPQDCINEPPHLLERKVAAASFVAAVADYTKAQLIRQIDPALWDRVHVIRCAVAVGPDALAPHPRQTPPRVLVVSRISPEKGLVVALEALALVVASGREAQLELVGPGPFEANLQPHVERLGLVDRVEWRGPLAPSAVMERMRQADILCLPSFAEGLPVTIIEAMHHGAVVVASGISGVPELVTAETGLLVPPARPDLLAEALSTLVAEPELRAVMAKAAQVRVMEFHDPDRSADALSHLLRTC